MNDFITAIILGIVEGLTEFLPISSTGHLILVNQFVTFAEQFTKMFDIVIQVGAVLAVVVYFRDKLIPFGMNKSKADKANIWDLWKKTIVGVFPALVIGATLGKHIQEALFNPITVSLALLIGGIILIWVENKKKRVTVDSIKSMNYRTAFLIGLIQCLAMIPGTSRSASTIIGAMLLGASRAVAAEFSFFLAIPTLVAASAYSLLKTGVSLNSHEAMVLTTGFVVSFFVAWAVIASFMKFISKRDFKWFGYYRIVLGVLVLLYFTLIA